MILSIYKGMLMYNSNNSKAYFINYLLSGKMIQIIGYYETYEYL